MTEDLINTLEFWQQVASEYQPDGWNYNICYSSPTFKTAWFNSPYLGDICLLREEFLMTRGSEFFEGDTVRSWSLLFILKEECVVISDDIFFVEVAKIRKDFIDFCIQKFTS